MAAEPGVARVSPEFCYDGERHVWSWTKGPKMPFFIGRCMDCGYYNWPEIHADLRALGVKLVGE